MSTSESASTDPASISHRDPNFNETVSRFKATFPLKVDGLLSDRFVSADSAYKSSSKINPEFNSFQIEQLADQASMLLERALLDRTEKDEISSKGLLHLLELLQYFELEQIHQGEIKAGLFRVPVEEAADSELAARERFESYRDAAAATIGMITANEKAANDLSLTAGAVAAISGYPNTHRVLDSEGYIVEPFQSNVDGKLPGNTIQAIRAGGIPGAIHPASVLQLLTEKLYSREQRQAREQLTNSKILQEGERDAAAAQLSKASRAHSWARADEGFKTQRNEVTMAYLDEKLNATLQPDGILNYFKRIDGIQARFDEGLDEALARLHALAKGLRLVFGYAEAEEAALPKSSFEDTSERHPGKKLALLDRWLLWVRNVKSFLVATAHKDQGIVLAVSLADAIPNFDPKASKWTVELSEADSIFQDQVFPRLRGISCSVVANDDVDFSAVIRCTGSAKTAHVDATGKKSAPLDEQPALPALRAGRVARRGATRTPDLIGASTYYNASPVATWEIELRDGMFRERTHEIEDLILEFHYVYQTLSAPS